MCPACVATVARTAAGALSTGGGIVALVLSTRRVANRVGTPTQTEGDES